MTPAWTEMDSNHRSNLQQIYSLSPLATRESVRLSCQYDSDKIELYRISPMNASIFPQKSGCLMPESQKLRRARE